MSARNLRITLLVLTVTGIGVATYLTYIHYAGIKPLCGRNGGGCEIVASRSLVSSNSRAMRASSAPRACARTGASWTFARATDSLLLVAGCMLANQSTPRPFPGRSRAGRGRID